MWKTLVIPLNSVWWISKEIWPHLVLKCINMWSGVYSPDKLLAAAHRYSYLNWDSKRKQEISLVQKCWDVKKRNYLKEHVVWLNNFPQTLALNLCVKTFLPSQNPLSYLSMVTDRNWRKDNSSCYNVTSLAAGSKARQWLSENVEHLEALSMQREWGGVCYCFLLGQYFYSQNKHYFTVR